MSARVRGVTSIPRWTLDPVSGIAEHEVTVADDLEAALRLLAHELGLPLSSLLLAAHARVLAALSGDCDVTTGYVPEEGGQPLPCRLATGAGSWRALLLDTHRVEAELLSHQDFPLTGLSRELGVVEPLFDTELDLSGGDALTAGTVLQVSVSQPDGGLVLRLRFRTDELDSAGAARIAGYHLIALASMVADPDAEHGKQSLLSADERRLQLEGLTGPRRQLPDRRFHELFEQQVQAHPDAAAAVHGAIRWTYRELNDRANRIGRSLLSRGLRPEAVVAVVTERNLDWMAAVLAIFKAGGVYLPVAPWLPADRIASMLSRAECELVLTEHGSSAALHQAVVGRSGVQTLLIDAAYEEGHPGGNLSVDVAADQLAYIFFTSGSTGEPKGAMCEHAGMLNHLLAKVEDLQIGPRQVVAQTAPQCFDISLWQLVSALLVGGRTLLIQQEVLLDVERFVDTIVDSHVNVLQVVPSYLDVMLSSLERHSRGLPDLRYVSVTGEALTLDLTRRWFATQPTIPLVNAYGLTETSDDTNHLVMDRVPDGDGVSLGRPVRNACVYIVDEHLSLAPLGAPGEIVFSGVCVGRGYVNDLERTGQAFMDDPHRDGERLYRSGDYGRWLPDGSMEYLGRRDTQVKIRGFRIEIGEIESKLAAVPAVHHAAVVVAEEPDRSKNLVAFCSGPRAVDAADLRRRLAESLPAYMIPTTFHWQQSLPLTANGKTDRKALAALAGEQDLVEAAPPGPRTAAEQRLANAWSEVLGIPLDRISSDDDFFDLGGTSLSAVRLIICLDRAVSLEDVSRHSVLSDLARLLPVSRNERKR